MVLYRAIQQQRWDKADAALAELDKLDPPKEGTSYDVERFRILAGRERYREAYQLVRQDTDLRSEDVALQNRWAWEIATATGLAERDLDFAEKIARRGHEAAKGKDGEIADTLARILFMKGRTEEAIRVQRQAVEAASGRRKTHFQENLASYEAGKLPPP